MLFRFTIYTGKDGKGSDRMKKEWHTFLIILGFIVIFFIVPYAKVEILSTNSEEKLGSFDISCFDNVYGEGTPEIYDQKIYEYRKERYAKALFVLGECEFGVMVELSWNSDRDCWELEDYQTMWTVHGGSAQEFYWPLYYADELLLGQQHR